MQSPRPPAWRRALPHAAVVVFCFVLAVITTCPLIGQLGTHLPNIAEYHDAIAFTWNNWWIHHALVDLHTKPYLTNYLLVPFPLDLRLHPLGLLYGLVSAPLIPLLSPLAVVNLQTLFTPVLNGYAVFLLVRWWVRRDDVAVLSGAALSMTPAIDFHLAMGRPGCAAIWPVALALLFLIRIVDEPNREISNRRLWWSSLGLAAALIALLLVDQQMSIFGGLILSLTVATILATRPRAILDRALLPHALAVVLLIAFPFRVLYIRPFFQTPGYTVPDPSEALAYSVPPWMTVNPADVWRLHGAVLPLGLLVALALVNRDRRVVVGIACALVSVWLTMGPVASGTQIPMLFAALRHLPGFAQFRAPYRFQIPAAFGMALALAVALAYVLGRFEQGAPGRRSRGRWIVAGLAFLVTLDTIAHRAAYGFVTHPVPDEPVYHRIAETPGDFVVLEIPFGVRSGTDMIGRGDDLMFYQTVHGKRMFNGYLTRIPLAALDYYRKSQAVRFLAEETFTSADIAADVGNLLREHQVGFVLIHREMLSKARFEAIKTVLAGRTDLEPVPTGTPTLAFRRK